MEALRYRIYLKWSRRGYVNLLPVENPVLEAKDVSIVWDGSMAWLEETAKAVRQRVFEEGRDWWGKKLRTAGGPPLDSQSDPYTEWRPVGDRDLALTFPYVDSDERSKFGSDVLDWENNVECIVERVV